MLLYLKSRYDRIIIGKGKVQGRDSRKARTELAADLEPTLILLNLFGFHLLVAGGDCGICVSEYVVPYLQPSCS